MSFFEELKRRNVVRVGAAYVVIGWLIAQVAEFAFESFDAPGWVLKVLIVVLLLGLPMVLVFAWAFELTPEGVKREKDVDRSQSIVGQTGKKLEYVTMFGVLAIVVLLATERMGEPKPADAVQGHANVNSSAPLEAPVRDKSIAVLPFVAMTASQDDEFFADGLSEELLNVLAQIEGLKVAGRTSSFYYKGRNEDLREIGETLGSVSIGAVPGVPHLDEGEGRRQQSLPV